MTQHILTLNNYLQSPLQELIRLVKEFHQAKEHRRKVRATVNELNQLTNRELADIGLTRGDIWSVAQDDVNLEQSNIRY